MNLLPFQKVGVDWLTQHFRCILADDPGLGKTIQILGLINECPGIRNVLVVCPATLKWNWRNEARTWLHRPAQIHVMSGRQSTGVVGNFVIVNYDILDARSHDLAMIEWDLVVVDEAHNLKNVDAKRSKAFFSKLIKANRLVFLTGTPIPNRPVELWTMLRSIDSRIGSYETFGERFGNGHWVQTPYGQEWNDRGASNLDELRKILEPVMLRRLKKDVLPDLPAKFRTILEVGEPLPSKQLMERLEAEFGKTWKAKLGRSTFMAPADQEILAKIRHQDALEKVPWAVSHVKTLLETVEKVILFAYHRDVIAQLTEQLSIFAPASIVGGMSDRAKNAAVANFQTDPFCRVFIGQMNAAGEGITLTAADHEVFVELDWTPKTLRQCEDRAHRIGQTRSVCVQYLVRPGTIDSMLGKSLEKKMRIIDRIVDGVSPEESEPADWFSEFLKDC